MDIMFAQIQADLRSNDALRQSGALLQARQQFGTGRDISVIAKPAIEEIVASPASDVSKKLAFDLIRSTRLTADLWEFICTDTRSDLGYPDPDVTAAAVLITSGTRQHRHPQDHVACALFSLAFDDQNKTAIGVLGALLPPLRALQSDS